MMSAQIWHFAISTHLADDTTPPTLELLPNPENAAGLFLRKVKKGAYLGIPGFVLRFPFGKNLLEVYYQKSIIHCRVSPTELVGDPKGPD
jgi:hypothetical protein